MDSALSGRNEEASFFCAPVNLDASGVTTTAIMIHIRRIAHMRRRPACAATTFRALSSTSAPPAAVKHRSSQVGG